MSITEATEADIPRLRVLVEMCYRETGATKKGWCSETHILGGIRTTEEMLKKEMKDSNGTFLKYTDDNGEINGCVYSLLNRAEKTVYIGVLCVNQEIQAKGIGKQLMSAAENIGVKNGCTKATIKVVSIRRALVEWYIRQGYQSTGELIPFALGGGVGDPIGDIPLEMVTMERLL